jgi:hypothetical protein
MWSDQVLRNKEQRGKLLASKLPYIEVVSTEAEEPPCLAAVT